MMKMKNKKLIYGILVVVFIIVGASLFVYLLKSPILCKDSLDCPIKMKCKNFVCIDVGCIKEGQRIPITAISPAGFEQRKHMAIECCEGLKAIPPLDYFDKDCNFRPRIGVTEGAICSDCGNGTCESWENKCNCPKDCK